MNVAYCALDENQFNRICTCSSTKEICNTLKIIFDDSKHYKKTISFQSIFFYQICDRSYDQFLDKY